MTVSELRFRAFLNDCPHLCPGWGGIFADMMRPTRLLAEATLYAGCRVRFNARCWFKVDHRDVVFGEIDGK